MFVGVKLSLLRSSVVALTCAATAGAFPIPQRPAKSTPLAALGDGPWGNLGDVRLPSQGDLALLRRFDEPWVERQGDWRSFYGGRFGPASWTTPPRLEWTLSAWQPSRSAPTELELVMTPPREMVRPELGTAELLPSWLLEAPPRVDASFVSATRTPRCKAWERPYTVTLARYGGERDSFRVLECDGSVAIDALDRLSVVARPAGADRPELPLPLEPLPESELIGEWVPNVRLLDPRLLWVVARISEAFPGRAIYLISGYRRDGHESFHRKGRALDLFVMGVSNDALVRVCRTLKDVGCGFYPNNKFVHVDVRPPGTGHAIWIDVSEPGTPSRYVDSWPGIVESGALSWGNGE
jgi:hypothetical protein